MDDLDALVADVWRSLEPTMRADAARLSALVADLDADAVAEQPPPHDGVPDPRWAQVRELAHRLAGSLGSLGQREAGAAAVALEELSAGLVHPPSAAWPDIVARTGDLVARLGTPSASD
ncbi:MAG: Hpt domain-containing protein [Nitriliruptoraceae bacterium]|nr:Hpt domain-containing protein [Nitriliruptoraceae bacterium]